MKIGITADINLVPTEVINLRLANYFPKQLIDVLQKHDIVPLLLPVAPEEMAKELVKSVDGVIIPGGPDIAPYLYGEEPLENIGNTYYQRDLFEIALIKETLAQRKPLMGICRGIQIINVALGGTLYQDLASQYKSDKLIQHAQKSQGFLPTHHVNLQPGSFLYQALGKQSLVNSRHHEAVKKVGTGLHVTATAPDGVIEGIESDDGLIVAVQWHPENLWQHHADQEQLFVNFFAKAAAQKERK
ncbi:gamma-glutamyl-gamma-aminobutyrate hydrolase family protein [Lactobacillus sp. ESL0791]|uniref:gamma-glutamyl-gamma-aminobutyrate hydrolase family protein n=1 Tax=Lactobacillus sp. ESL0791 TaxID=2983234 RepID=UPI0023F7E18B|nr:gamma-glutamyl-gamma-aminobutyrate hydrolase family protein [Lactobacillus sp. ESL0791]MDF7639293.1 gamma-glutamyl-gamma-aminobutyrate hydrolase family protein [Lactobacillus sp. ESL0791]